MRRTATPALAGALLALTLTACGSSAAGEEESAGAASTPAATTSDASASPTAETEPSESANSAAAVPPGTYITLADYEQDAAAYADTKVVYFFHAPWCPSCRATEAAIDADGVPEGLTLVKVDYDTNTELRQKYGITYQHTFVQVDENGAELATWTGSADGESILAETV
jgi:thiol-disulfide isomerase/thioredoxin